MRRLVLTPALLVIVMIVAFVCRVDASEPEVQEFVGPPAPVVTTKYLKVSVERSLEASLVGATEKILGAQLAQVTKRVLVWWIDVRRELHPGDIVEIVYEERERAEPIVHAVWFTSGKLRGSRAAVLYKPEGGQFARWYDEKGHEVEQRLKHGPLEAYEQVTSLLSDGRGHRGVDFKVPIGAPILAPFDGRIVRKNWSRRRNGTCLQIVDGGGRTTAYFLHLSHIKRGMTPGTRVKRGQVLAFSGNTGRSSAPLLQYLLEKNDRVIDPFRFHATWRASLSDTERAKALRLLSRLGELRTRST